MNQFVWNMRYPEAEKIDGMILMEWYSWNVIVPPGNYYASIKMEKDSVELPFTIKADPNYVESQEEYDQQFAFLMEVRNKFNEVQKAIKDIRLLRSQINTFIGIQDNDIPKEVKHKADSMNIKLTGIEETLYQTKSKSGQDVLNYPIRLNDKLSGVFDAANSGNFPPSKQVKEVYADLAGQADVQLKKLKFIEKNDLPALNDLIHKRTLPVIGVGPGKWSIGIKYIGLKYCLTIIVSYNLEIKI